MVRSFVDTVDADIQKLSLRRDFSQHSACFLEFRVSDDRGAKEARVKVSARLSTAFAAVYNYLLSSFLLFSPFFYEGLHLGAGL